MPFRSVLIFVVPIDQISPCQVSGLSYRGLEGCYYFPLSGLNVKPGQRAGENLVLEDLSGWLLSTAPCWQSGPSSGQGSTFLIAE